MFKFKNNLTGRKETDSEDLIFKLCHPNTFCNVGIQSSCCFQAELANPLCGTAGFSNRALCGIKLWFINWTEVVIMSTSKLWAVLLCIWDVKRIWNPSWKYYMSVWARLRDLGLWFCYLNIKYKYLWKIKENICCHLRILAWNVFY